MGRYPLLLFAVRALLVLALRDPTRGPDPAGPGGPAADDVEFETLARHVAAGEGFINKNGAHTPSRASGWPTLLAGVSAWLGTHTLIVYALICLPVLMLYACAGLARPEKRT